MENKALLQRIEKASQVVGTTWPLYSFVTSNPLSGYEALPFQEACLRAYTKTGSIAYPEISFFKLAMEKGLLSENKLKGILKEQEFAQSKNDFFKEFDELQHAIQSNPNHQVDQIVVKWLSVFLDEGLADWQMPNKEQGFFKAWASLAKYDQDLKLPKQEKIPNSSAEAIVQLCGNLSEVKQLELFENHLVALPGWVGYIKNRKDTASAWNQKYPVELVDYLAVRMLIGKYLNIEIQESLSVSKPQQQLLNIVHSCLCEVETAWQADMVNQLKLQKQTTSARGIPDAQLVFCIDTRSELIRRNIEDKGKYETFGYAGFFGIAMDYEAPFSGITRKSCPPILASAYKVTEKEVHSKDFKSIKKKHKQATFKSYFLGRMKNILPSAFGYVEGAGLAYGYKLVNRTFANPKSNKEYNQTNIENTCQTQIHSASTSESLSLNEKTQIVKGAFDLTGWKEFAPLVVFAGHGSHTANNPFASSLDCGACAASPGRHNARMIAGLANLKEVRKALLEEHQIKIPETTLFLGAEHNTTTDEITLFDTDAPKVFEEQIDSLKKDLTKAQTTATAERLGTENSVEKAYKKSTDWSETRPEWGLAKNAGFIIGPRSLTQHTNLDGQCFLHSYDWKTDTDGSALNGILNGPMVVTQWINNHYYFSTVDNNTFGSGSKITHNVVGRFGVVQGNGGDLKTGLPLQSVNQTDQVNYHQPQRLSVFVNAPKTQLSELISANAKIKELIDNQWIHLLVIDPTNNNKVERYVGNLKWEKLVEEEHYEEVFA
jgi:uncharacterized protein YbcC (UPF0753/DUF2309 family)